MTRRKWRGSALAGPCAGLVALSLTSTGARAEDGAPPRWQIDVKAAYVVLGASGARATGGIMPSVTGMRRWPLGDAVDIGLGADVGLFGLGGDARWLGFLGGPAASTRVTPFRVPVSLDLTARLDFGRIPVCNAWGLCLRYLGFFPAVEGGAAYLSTQHVAIVATCGVRFIRTLAWSGVSVEPAAAGRISW
ncbi:hypothetical protein [Sorangium sp. So ce1097]|uniref:hypothetical protein n=1 Tax=Sorangium sp. So ce1097 TaxID=3133330 RepID=UPI003F608CEA